MIQNIILATLMTLTYNIKPLAIMNNITIAIENDTFVNNAYAGSGNYRNSLRMGSSGYQNFNTNEAKMIAYRFSVSNQYYVRATEKFHYDNYGVIIRTVELNQYTPNYRDINYALLYSNFTTLEQKTVSNAWGEIYPEDTAEVKQAVNNLITSYQNTSFTFNSIISNINTLINTADDWGEGYNQVPNTADDYNTYIQNMNKTLNGTNRIATDNYTQTYENQSNNQNWYAVYIIKTEYETQTTNNTVSKAYEQIFADMGKSINIEFEYDQATIIYEDKPIDIPGLMFTILGMPFAWISTAFNFTLWPDTMYAINVGHTLLGIVFLSFAIWIIKRVLK